MGDGTFLGDVKPPGLDICVGINGRSDLSQTRGTKVRVRRCESERGDNK
jgi:hypothetical protein